MAGLAVRLVCSLAVVVGLLLLLSRLAGRRFAGRAGAPVQVLHRQPISRGSSVSVVTVGTRILVLGATEQRVTLLAELEPDELGDGAEPGVLGLLADAAPATVTGLPTARETAPETAPKTAPETARHRSSTPAGPLGGSVLSPQTWRQALAAVTSGPGAPSAGARRAS